MKPRQQNKSGQDLPKLVCKITLGPLSFDTAAPLDQLAALILMLVREHSETTIQRSTVGIARRMVDRKRKLKIGEER